MKRSRLVAAIANAAKGVAIGAANTVPGVSGGTIAVVTGIYDR
ncbi:MAG: undecaprenyl phosphate translocase family protein, partial [Alkalispirochaeta sp.]